MLSCSAFWRFLRSLSELLTVDMSQCYLQAQHRKLFWSVSGSNVTYEVICIVFNWRDFYKTLS